MALSNDELKKHFYKNPEVSAKLIKVRKGNLHYELIVDHQLVVFLVPFSDIGDAEFGLEMIAKYLIRYMV